MKLMIMTKHKTSIIQLILITLVAISMMFVTFSTVSAANYNCGAYGAGSYNNGTCTTENAPESNNESGLINTCQALSIAIPAILILVGTTSLYVLSKKRKTHK